jgi:hypothetical protein
MNFTKRPLPKHRRARLIAWTLAMLAWLASVLFGQVAFAARHERQRGARMSLAGLTRMVKMLIISRAIDLARRRWRASSRAHAGRPIKAPKSALRVMLGARVHRMLARGDVGGRIAVLIHALRHIDAYAALVAKRLRRGLTRIWLRFFAITPSRTIPLASLFAPRAAFADSS